MPAGQNWDIAHALRFLLSGFHNCCVPEGPLLAEAQLMYALMSRTVVTAYRFLLVASLHTATTVKLEFIPAIWVITPHKIYLACEESTRNRQAGIPKCSCTYTTSYSAPDQFATLGCTERIPTSMILFQYRSQQRALAYVGKPGRSSLSI